MITALDYDKKFTKKLGKMIKKAFPLIGYESFNSVHECYSYLRTHDADIVFLSKEIGKSLLDYQIVISEIRYIKPHIVIVLISENMLDGSTAYWSMKNYIADYIQKPFTAEKLRNVLETVLE